MKQMEIGTESLTDRLGESATDSRTTQEQYAGCSKGSVDGGRKEKWDSVDF